MRQHYNDAYLCEGSLALKPRRSTDLRVIDGCARSSSAPNVKPSASSASAGHSCPDDGIAAGCHDVRAKRLAICLSIMTILLCVFGFGIDSRNALVAHEALSNQQSSVITVGKGDTLWNIAESHSVQGASTNDVLTWIKDQNHLASSALQVGQTLVVPSGMSS